MIMDRAAIKDFFKKYKVEFISFFVVIAVFAPSLKYGFQVDWDDSTYVIKNPYLVFSWENLVHCFTTPTIGLLTPLTSFSFMLDRLIWQTQEVAFGYRLTNILLHAASTVFLIGIIKHLGVRSWLAFCCALFWAVHPQRLESVVWIAERKDVLSGFFALASFFVFMKAPGKWKNITGAVLLFLLSLLSKPSAIGLPLAACVYLCYKNPQKFNWKYILYGLCGMGAIVIGLCFFLNIFPNFIPMPRLFSVVSHNALFYTVNGIFPVEISPCYPYVDWHDIWMIPAALIMVIILVVLGRKAEMSDKSILMTFLAFLLVFAALFAPFTGAFIFNPTDYADRYAYFPNLAVWIFLGFFLEQIFRKNLPAVSYIKLLGCVLGVSLAGLTLWYMQMWKDSRTLVRWGIYTHDLPNDKFLMIYAKHGFMDSDPGILQETVEILRKKQQIPDIPRDTDRDRLGRKCTVDALDMSAHILYAKYYRISGQSGKAAEYTLLANQKYDHFVTTNQEVLLLERHIYESGFKYLLLEFFAGNNDVMRMNHMEKWASKTTDRYGKIFPDHSFNGALKFYRKDYRGAISDWNEALKTHKNSPDILKNIRIAEQKLRELE